MGKSIKKLFHSQSEGQKTINSIKELSASCSEESKCNETNISDFEVEETPIMQSMAPHSSSLDVSTYKLSDCNQTNIIRSKSVQNDRIKTDLSPSPPFIAQSISPCIDKECSVDKNEENENEIEMETKYKALNAMFDSLQMTVNAMKQSMDAQNAKINEMNEKMNKMKNELTQFQNRFDKMNNDEIKEQKLEEVNDENLSLMASTMKYFDYGWDHIKEREIVSFERSFIENIYHSLFMYFMNGLMVIFNVLTKLFVLIGCCLCSKNKMKNNQRLQTTKNWNTNMSIHNNLRRRRRKKRHKIKKNKNVWKEEDSQSSAC